MASMDAVVNELMKERTPSLDSSFRRVAFKLCTTYHEVKTIYNRFRDSFEMVTELRNELDITRSERDGYKMANKALEHEREKLTALPTKAEWKRADRLSLYKMNYLEGEEMTVGDYHTLMGKG